MPRAERAWATAALALLATAVAAAPAGARQTAPAAPKLRSASVRQIGAMLQWTLRLGSAPAAGQSYCLLIRTGTLHTPRRRVCIGGDPLALTSARLTRSGAVVGEAPLAGTVTPSGTKGLAASFAIADAGLSRRKFRWQVQASCDGAGACRAQLPAHASVSARTVTPPSPQPIGCTPTGAPQIYAAPGSPQTVALTFDDGPGPATPAVLSELERERVPATFFLIGRQIAGSEALLRRELADGDALGNHTWDHANMSGGGRLAEITDTQAAIKAASGYTPCLLRPPYGATSAALLAELAPLRLTATLWNVDPADWSLPGTATIVSRVLAQVQPGSIVLLHDGGGNRSQTVAALPTIVHALRERGYAFATVTQLLGYATQTGAALPLPATHAGH